MSLNILKILSFLSILVFFGLMLFSGSDRNKIFVCFILTAFPFLNITTFENLCGFDIITFIFFFVFYKKRDIKIPGLSFYRLMLILLTISIAAGMIVAEERVNQENIIEFIRIYPVFIFSYVVIVECLYEEKFIKTIVTCLKITLIASFVFLCLQFIFGVSFSLSRTMNANIVSSSGIRYNSFMIDPQVYSQFLGALSFICLIKTDPNKNVSKINYVLVMLSLLGILVAGGRAGLIGWCIGLALLVLFSNNTYRIILLLSAGAIYILTLAYPEKFVIFNRGTDLNDAYSFRTSIWADAYQIFLNHPFLGIGINNYARYVSIHNPDQVWLLDNELISFDHPESGYFKFLTEFGAIGFILFFMFIIIPVIISLIGYLRKKDTNIILMISALICWLIGFYSTYSFGDNRIKILVGTIISIMIAYITNQKSPEDEQEIIDESNIINESEY